MASNTKKPRSPSFELPWEYCQCEKKCRGHIAQVGELRIWLHLTFTHPSGGKLKEVQLRSAHPPEGVEIGVFPTLEEADLAARTYRPPDTRPDALKRERVLEYA